MLPKLPNQDRIKKAQTVTFGGINRQPNAPDGSVYWTANMGSDRMPCLSPRKRRYYIGQYNNCCGMFAYNGLYMVLDKTIYKDGVTIGTAKTNKDKRFAVMNDAVTNVDQVVMFPDKQLIVVENDGSADWQSGCYLDNVEVQFYVNEATGNSYFANSNTSSRDTVRFDELGIYPGDTITVNVQSYSPLPVNAQVLEVTAHRIEFVDGVFPERGTYKVTISKGQPTTVKLMDVSAYFRTRNDTASVISTPITYWNETPFEVGDMITVSGSSIEENNISAVIAGIETHALIFEPGTFTVPSALKMESLTITKARTIPVDRVSDMETTVTVTDAVFQDQTAVVSGQTVTIAEGNTIFSANTNFGQTALRVGDCIHIVGSASNDKPVVIREIDGSRLRFDPNSFVDTVSGTESIKIERTVPDLDGLFVHEQRLWGWKGSIIYASKWNDPLNFEVFDGLESDSWTLPMDGSGDILGGIVYQGYPMFFKQDKAIRIYGDRPSQFRSMEITDMGVHPGCGDSPAIAGDTLYYVSRNGMTKYTGGYATIVHHPFGEMQFTKAVAGSDGRRYFLSAYDGKEGWALYVYDTMYDTWFREDTSQATLFSCDRGNLYFLIKSGAYKYLQLDGHAPTPPEYANREPEIYSEVEFCDITGNYWTAGRGYGNPSRKGTSKVQIRVTLEAGSTLDVSMAFEGGEEILVKQLVAGEGKHSYYLPIIPRRSDNYKIILRGYGDWTLNSLVREEYSGSDIH